MRYFRKIYLVFKVLEGIISIEKHLNFKHGAFAVAFRMFFSYPAF
jgi:hypothetical protein